MTYHIVYSVTFITDMMCECRHISRVLWEAKGQLSGICSSYFIEAVLLVVILLLWWACHPAPK